MCDDWTVDKPNRVIIVTVYYFFFPGQEAAMRIEDKVIFTHRQLKLYPPKILHIFFALHVNDLHHRSRTILLLDTWQMWWEGLPADAEFHHWFVFVIFRVVTAHLNLVHLPHIQRTRRHVPNGVDFISLLFKLKLVAVMTDNFEFKRPAIIKLAVIPVHYLNLKISERKISDYPAD